MNNLIISQEENNVLTITLNRFDKKNALNTEMYAELCRLFQHAQAQSSIHCVLIQGNEQCFCAGNDLADFMQHNHDEEFIAFTFIKILAQFTKPIVVAVAGPAVGIGTTLLLHSDYIIAANNSKFKLPFSQLGLCPEAASSALLSLKLGHNKAFELLVLGETFGPEQALSYQLINQLCQPEELLTLAKAVADKIAQLPNDSVLTSRKLLKQAMQENVSKALENEAEQFSRLLATTECQAILASFFTK
ncbi:enoyl-CoA hydratase-related protein [Thalassotalea ganghwensis]